MTQKSAIAGLSWIFYCFKVKIYSLLIFGCMLKGVLVRYVLAALYHLAVKKLELLGIGWYNLQN